jgi:hypothetical protein
MGLGLVPGVRLAFGSTNVAAFFCFWCGRPGPGEDADPRRRFGRRDGVTVTNPDGRSALATNAYTFASPEYFDVNGNWKGPAFSGDYDEPFTFTVVNGAVVSISARTSGVVALSSPVPITHGEFSFRYEDGVAVSGRILAPNEVQGLSGSAHASTRTGMPPGNSRRLNLSVQVSVAGSRFSDRREVHDQHFATRARFRDACIGIDRRGMWRRSLGDWTHGKQERPASQE